MSERTGHALNAHMSQAERFDLVVLGSGQGGESSPRALLVPERKWPSLAAN
jgi:hypothetical protein